MNTNRTRALLCSAMLAIAAAAVSAQPMQSPATLDGAWTARIKLLNGRHIEARVNLLRDEGTWKTILQSTADPCVGLLWPVTVRRVDDSSLEFKFLASKALTGCADSAMVFKRVDDNTLQGRSQIGLEVTVTRP